MVINAFGTIRRNRLTVSERNGALAAKLIDEKDGEAAVTAIYFKDDILSCEYTTPTFQLAWGKEPNKVAAAWLRITGNSLDGALSSGGSSQTQYDVSVKGKKKRTTPPMASRPERYPTATARARSGQ